eukprot:1158687-Pelagomonas_calceolata.AAC.13
MVGKKHTPIRHVVHKASSVSGAVHGITDGVDDCALLVHRFWDLPHLRLHAQMLTLHAHAMYMLR